MKIQGLTGTRDLDQELKGLILHVNSINELINRIAGSTDVDTIFSSLVEGIHTELGYARVGILVPDDSRSHLRMAYALGVDAERAEKVRIPMELAREINLELLEHRRVNVLRCLQEKQVTGAMYEAFGEAPPPCALVPFASWHQKRCWEIDYCLLGHSALAGVPGSARQVKVSDEEVHQVCTLCEFFPMRGILWVDNQPGGETVRENLFTLWVLAKQAALAIENAVLFERGRRLTIRDGLTGLYNRRHLLEVVDYEVERSRRFKHPFSIVCLDVDGFASINRDYGFKGGDELVKYLAVLLRRSIRGVDVLFRCGTDEFTCLFPKTEENTALKIATRLVEKVQRFPFYLAGKAAKVTMSAGLATFPEDGQKGRDLLFLAEKALDAARQEGGNTARDAHEWRP